MAHFRRVTVEELRTLDWRALARPGRGQAALLVEASGPPAEDEPGEEGPKRDEEGVDLSG